MIDTRLLLDVVAYSAQACCVVALGAAVAAVIRIDAAGVRYAYWRTLLAVCLTLPWLQVRQSVVASPGNALATMSLDGLALAGGAAGPSTSFDWIAVVGWVLVAGIVFRVCRVGIGLWRLRRLRQAGHLAPPSDAITEVQELVRVAAEIRYVPGGQPVTFGFRRPVILLPEMLRAQSAEVQRVVLCHELFHVRRRDWMWVVVEECVAAALWFNPAVLWLVARVRLAREEVVDELTVLATAQRRAYLEALLVFADAPTAAPAAAFARRRHLFRRMTLISKEAVMSSSRIVVSVVTMMAVIAAGVWSASVMFPVTQVVFAQSPGGAALGVAQAGPLEQQAKPITPENPIPRRTFSVVPQRPAGDTNGVVAIPVRVVVDRQGRVAESRYVGIGAAGTAAPPSEAFAKAAIDAVRQWQYDPPADGPIAFDVVFSFAPGAEPRLLAHGGTAALTAMQSMTPNTPAPPPPPGWGAGAVRVGGNIEVPKKVRHVAPAYPPVAQAARVQGVVILEVVVGAEGRVTGSRILRSVPLLDQAAQDSVNLWEFEPVLLNGSPVPFIMTVTVQFTLQN